MGFPRQEYWSGMPFPSPGDRSNPGIEPVSLTLQVDSLPLIHCVLFYFIPLFLYDGLFTALFCWYKFRFLMTLFYLLNQVKILSVSSVQSLSHVQLFATPWTAARQASLSITNSQSLLNLMYIESVMLSNHLILCHHLLLLPSVLPSIRVFSSESVLHIRWPNYWSFSFSISPSNEYSGLISFRIDWFDLLAVEGTFKSLFQHTVQKHQLFGAQFSLWSNSHIHTWLLEKPKTIVLTRRTLVSKVMSLLFSSKEQAFLNFMAKVTNCSDFGAQENKVCHCFHCFPIYLPWSVGDWMPWSLYFECWILSQLFHSSLSLSSSGSLVPLRFLQ